STGRILGTYKDRYIHLNRIEVLVYENEEEKDLIEKICLDNYDKCHELRSTFKKNRFILIRCLKPGNKVPDIKFQAQTAEEKQEWIKAFSEGINKAKNKIFDEVSCYPGWLHTSWLLWGAS
uniref:PH domain-containing protein n=1 Tax=Erpetoichthys calabaricus TaxID=27687 RepID=A0A8C4TLC1_ERPCA